MIFLGVTSSEIPHLSRGLVRVTGYAKVQVFLDAAGDSGLGLQPFLVDLGVFHRLTLLQFLGFLDNFVRIGYDD